MRRNRIVAIAVAALLYLLLPVDIVPDFWPLVGWVDDLLAASLAVYLVLQQLKKGVPGRGQREAPSQAPASAPEADDPYRVLGLEPGADPERIRRAYREQMAQYHPDKVAHLGPELRQLAQRRTLAIQRAYERLTEKS
ncbi:MAG: DnaJ domain-containing protein [Elusimicrobia bacterium]|nr:DnaJ domain-containing protein [Elusimicrobiota bacterium]